MVHRAMHYFFFFFLLLNIEAIPTSNHKVNKLLLADIKILRFFHMKNVSFFSFKNCYMSCVVRKPAFCICENKDADQLRGNYEACQRLCFHNIDNISPLLPIKTSSHLVWLYSLVCA